MGLFFSPTTIFAAFLLLYLASFIVFAIIRIATGVSIQRIGYFSLRRIAYTPKEGVHVEIRGLGFSLHRPSFTQPTWVSLRLTDLKVTFAPKAVGGWDAQQKAWEEGSETQPEDSNEDSPPPDQEEKLRPNRAPGSRNKTWKTLSGINEKIKKLHKQIHWLAMIDVVATNTTVRFVEAGQIQVGSFTMAVDTRRKMVDRGRLFRHKKDPSGDQSPVEWIVNVRNILLTVDSREPIEVLDNLGLNIHGLLYSNLEGLRDTSVAVKLGRLHIPCDDLMVLSERFKGYHKPFSQSTTGETEDEISFADIVEELDKPGTREEAIVRTVADSKEFVSSVLRGIQEIQVALSFFRMSREVRPSSQTEESLLLNLVTHEVGIDFHRMDPKRPAHRMYFQRNDVAHQALLAAISISVTLDDSVGGPDKLLYVPMATTTIKTTLPSKAVNFSGNHDPAARNSNVLFANLVVTSPSIDIEPKHLSQLLVLTQAQALSSRGKTKSNRNLISRLLPKASIKLSIHEPVLRFVLPTENDYNLLISSISSISLDIESSHSTEAGLHYSLSSIYRITSHQLYYQTTSGFKHNLLVTESMELKAHLNATPEVCVVASGTLNNYSIHMVSGEVSRGVNQIVDQFLTHAELAASPGSHEVQKPRFLRRLPPWLLSFQFEATGFSVEVAGTDQTVGPTTRGIALQLQSWTAEYRAQSQEPHRKAMRRRTPSHSTIGDESPFRFHTHSPSKKSYQRPEDGRRLALHVRGLEGFVIESEGYMEPESFLNLPRFEVSFSTSSDLQGPIFHINSAVKEIYLQYSVYRCYALGVAMCVLQDAFKHDPSKTGSPKPNDTKPQTRDSDSLQDLQGPLKLELVTVDVKANLIQVRATMPADPPMLLQVYGLATGRHRWSSPFVRAQLLRLHAEAPKVRGAWARIVSMNSIRVDLRENRRKQGRSLIKERSIDLSTDFIRFGVPHQMVMHRIFDNLTNTKKVLEQLHHRFKTRTDEYILKKKPEEPKKVPRISVRSKALLFELEDDAFEWKLGSIYRLGLLEQKQRIAREEAYRMKVRKTEEFRQHEASSRFRTRSSNPYAHGMPRKRRDQKRSKSADGDNGDEDDEGTQRPVSRGRRGRKARYDPDGLCNLSGSSKIPAEDAWYKLQQYNARSWKRRIDNNLRFQNIATKEIRSLFSGADDPPDNMKDDESILAIPDRPGLMSALISDLHLVVDKPSFPIEDYAQYLHKIGKGMPLDTKYSLLIPMNVQLDMGEARVNLRDYPLDLLHVPALRPGQSPRLPSWSLRTDFVIAEEFRDYHSFRDVEVNIIPPGQAHDGTPHSGFSIDVKRTVSPVKTYSDATIEINTSLPTGITWGMSFQPVVQDMMKIIEGFSKPAIDPSDRVGFWDKIRLSFHSRINVVWKGDGDVHLRLKGSRDPYVVTGFGAGFVMCWRKDVRWEINTKDDPRKFMTVTSGEYVLAVPDYSHQARHSIELPENDVDRTSSGKSVIFKKVIMKLFGNVEWVAGLVFERDLKKGGRSLEFKPHYDVVLQNPNFIDDATRKDYDAFRGFRSNHIHLSVAVVAPNDRDWASPNKAPATSYNTVHLTPRFFTHFFNWWSLFSGVMSIPVRQGPLWPGLTKSSKKFSRHLATIKYNLLFSPLFLSHIYKHKDAEEYSDDVVSATGLKVRLDSFLLDLHQRREQVNTQVKDRPRQIKTTAMRINQAQLDFVAADFRAVSASIGGTNSGNIQNATADYMPGTHQEVPGVDLSQFTIPDLDYDWIDMDDFVEIDWVLPAESSPKTQILPLAYAPRFTYFRQTEHGHSGPDETGYSHFGDEPTHYCVMSDDNDPRRVQMELMTERLADIGAQIEYHERAIGEQELLVIRDGHQDSKLKVHFDLLIRQCESLQKRRKFLSAGLRRLEKQLLSEGLKGGTSFKTQAESDASETEESADDGTDPQIDGLYASPDDGFVSDFNNRFIIHNIQLKWNNSLRNIILRYSHQVSQRRGFVYYMSRRAVKFILDIVEEQGKNKRGRSGIFERASLSDSDHGMADDQEEKDESVQDRIEQLLSDANRFVNADDPVSTENKPRPASADDGKDIAPEFTPQNSYHLRLIAPQIQLQSEKNKKSVALITAKGMQLKVVSIMDKHRVSDDVSGLVQRRFTLDMDSAQFFVTTQKHLSRHIQLYAGNKYGNAPGSAWPPWVALEAVFDFSLNPFGFSKIIQKTSASLRYDKYNTLRLKYNEEVASGENGPKADAEGGEERMDQIWLDFPHLRAICDSSQYYSMYIIVLDLLLYSEPLAKVRSERLEKIMLASDFSDLRGAPETVNRLQRRIRQLEEIKDHFQIEARNLDKQGWEDRIAVEKDLASCEDELFFIMKAITTSQRKGDDRTSSHSHGILRWYISASEVVWHLMKSQAEPLVEFQLRKASYERTDNSDGSNNNTIEIERLHGLNLLPNAIYPQMIVPYLDQNRRGRESDDESMLQVKWLMLEAIAGIPVLDHFEVTLFPLKVQLEHDLGHKLFEYIFPGMGADAFENGGFSPFMIRNMPPLEGDESEDEETLDAFTTASPSLSNSSSDESQTMTGPGAIELRLKPTHTLPEQRRTNPPSHRKKHLAMTPLHDDSSSSRGLSATDRARSTSRPASARLPKKKSSLDSLRMISRQSTEKPPHTANGNESEERSRRFALARAHTSKERGKGDKTADDLTTMMTRASNYMTLAHVKINDVVLCLSYKGKGERNIEDVHDFVFRLPVLEYQNKTWSNLDLALRLKKDVIKALISHTPAILGNKFSHNRPSKQQQKRLRELANSAQTLPSSESMINTISDGDRSFISRSSNSERSESPRRSFNSAGSPLARSASNQSIHNPDNPSVMIHDSDWGDQDPPDTQRETHGPSGRRTSDNKSIASHGASSLDSEGSRKKTVRNMGRKFLDSLT